MSLDVSPSREIEVQREIHLRKAEKIRAKLNSSKETTSSSDLCFTFDLQKTLITPSISTGVAYYKRQLATYNLGNHNLANNDATMFMWHEGLASRGASEIGSCIWKFGCDKVQDGAWLMYKRMCRVRNERARCLHDCKAVVAETLCKHNKPLERTNGSCQKRGRRGECHRSNACEEIHPVMSEWIKWGIFHVEQEPSEMQA